MAAVVQRSSKAVTEGTLEEKHSVKFHFAKFMEAIGLPVQSKLFLYAAYETSDSDKQGPCKNPLITFDLSSKNGSTTTMNTNSHLWQQEGI